jgi:hypothetical protein
VDKIIDAGGLKIGQVLGVVQVPLRVQVTVTDFDWVEKTEIRHTHDYTMEKT